MGQTCKMPVLVNSRNVKGHDSGINRNLTKKGLRTAMMIVNRLLKKYKYSPDGEEKAVNTVISQCEM
jgi:hypothetical protein